MESWMTWFRSMGDKMVDQVGLADGREVTKNGVAELPFDESATTGYIVINAESMEEAVKTAEACPMITSTRVYEVMPSADEA